MQRKSQAVRQEGNIINLARERIRRESLLDQALKVLQGVAKRHNGKLYLFPESKGRMIQQLSIYLDVEMEDAELVVDALIAEKLIKPGFGRTGVYYWVSNNAP